MPEVDRGVPEWPQFDDDALVAVLTSIERGEVLLDAAGIQRVIDFLAHAARTVRRHAAGALAAGLIHGEVEPAAAESLLSNEDENTRWGAAYALARAGSPNSEVIDAVMNALNCGDGDVRWAAASIVVEAARDSDDLRERLRRLARDGTPRTRKMAVLCLCDSGERDGAFYRATLADEDPFVRLASITSMARCGDRSEASRLAMQAVADGDADARVRRGAAAVLRRLATNS